MTSLPGRPDPGSSVQPPDAFEHPAPDSHVRALVDVADKQDTEAVAHWYAEVRRHGRQAGRRVTADVVANLADFLRTGTEPERMEAVFTPRQLPPATTRPAKPAPAGPADRAGQPRARRSQARSSPTARTADGTAHSRIWE
ncbi:hypothetical protein AB0F03_37025 [Streptomyces sp. NPDC028722]|uniref:hypothetical protein n=1 Tax=Streptomyces sp. NPDC028722 TaxID=3155016 RepID=UPI0033EE113E